MLANGITLGYKETGASSYIDLVGLKEVPEMGDEPEKVENTCLADKTKQYEFGIGDPGDLEFKFIYKNDSEESPYRVLRKAAAEKKVLSFEETFPDGTRITWEAQVSVKLGGGGVNAAIEFTVKMALQSKMVFIDPKTNA